MKLIPILLLISSVCFGQKHSPSVIDIDRDFCHHHYYLTAYAYDTVNFEAVQNQWYMLSNPTRNAFIIYEAFGFHYDNDTLVSEIYGLLDARGQFRVSGPAGQANRMYEYRMIRERGGVQEVFWWFQTSSSGEIVLRTIASFVRVEPNDRLWAEIRTLSATGELHFYGGTIRVIKID